jgi:enediyne biosynthesis protein E5
VLFGVVVAIVQKAIFRAPIRGRMRHFMNPSNFGITAVLLAFPWVNIAPPYHFTENVPGIFRMLIPMLILTAGTVLNAMLTKKVPLIMGWVGAFVLQALVRHWIFDVALLSALGVMTGVAFVLFTNYMITDPGTTPVTFRSQFVFGASVATVYGVLMAFNVVYTLFFAVTVVCLARGLGWWVAYAVARRRERLELRAPDRLLDEIEPEAVPALAGSGPDRGAPRPGCPSAVSGPVRGAGTRGRRRSPPGCSRWPRCRRRGAPAARPGRRTAPCGARRRWW